MENRPKERTVGGEGTVKGLEKERVGALGGREKGTNDPGRGRNSSGVLRDLLESTKKHCILSHVARNGFFVDEDGGMTQKRGEVG